MRVNLKRGKVQNERRSNLAIREVLAEDLLTSWIPDVIDWVDIEHLASAGESQDGHISEVRVPRPDSEAMHVLVLPPPLHVQLNHKLSPLGDDVDLILGPSVCGYRRGAQKGVAYREEHDRFLDFISAGIEAYPLVVATDVRKFFWALTPEIVFGALNQCRNHRAVSGAVRLLEDFQSRGIRGLPAGYADSRMIANLILCSADQSIDAEFTRWVDDYRFFVSSQEEADAQLHRLSAALSDLNLELHSEKTKVLDREAASRELVGRPLASVYHPHDNPEQSCADLRTVFLEAALSPIANRRELRFALPRLADAEDPIAIDFAIQAIESLPWELPRIVSYLSVFVQRQNVAEAVLEASMKAVHSRNAWIFGRLAPLVARAKIRGDLVAALEAQIPHEESSAIWGLQLRLLALAGQRRAVQGVLADRVLDARAALAAYQDLDLEAPRTLRRMAPVTAQVLEGVKAPIPSPISIL